MIRGYGYYVWLQNIDGLVMARQYDTNKVNDYYRPIPVHSSHSNRGGGHQHHRGGGKPYMHNQDPTPPPRYDSADYDYKTTHYPSYPPNYPYDGTAPPGTAGPPQPPYVQPPNPQAYPGYEAPPQTVGYDSRAAGYTPAAAAPGYEHHAPYGYDERAAAAAAYSAMEPHHHQDYVYNRQQPGYEHDQTRYDVRESDSRYDDRRYDGDYGKDDSRYADSRESEGRYKDSYYERYYKGGRSSREQHSESSRY